MMFSISVSAYSWTACSGIWIVKSSRIWEMPKINFPPLVICGIAFLLWNQNLWSHSSQRLPQIPDISDLHVLQVDIYKQFGKPFLRLNVFCKINRGRLFVSTESTDPMPFYMVTLQIKLPQITRLLSCYRESCPMPTLCYLRKLRVWDDFYSLNITSPRIIGKRCHDLPNSLLITRKCGFYVWRYNHKV